MAPPQGAATEDIPLEHTSICQSNQSTKGQFMLTKFEDEFYLTSVSKGNHPSQCAQLAYSASLITCPITGYVDTLDPRVFLARNGGKHDSDSPTLYEAMNAEAYMEAMKVEIEALERQNTWISIIRPTTHQVLKSTWVFKLKRLPDGTPHQYKARFCVRGDLQIEGVDFFETNAPVVQWSTICMLLVSILTNQQVDYTNVFVQAEINEEIYVEYPKLFESVSGKDRVLKLKKSLYGLRQAP
jgi:Reverse transcriptase (RNA-dependent DNA polymerase)